MGRNPYIVFYGEKLSKGLTKMKHSKGFLGRENLRKVINREKTFEWFSMVNVFNGEKGLNASL